MPLQVANVRPLVVSFHYIDLQSGAIGNLVPKCCRDDDLTPVDGIKGAEERDWVAFSLSVVTALLSLSSDMEAVCLTSLMGCNFN